MRPALILLPILAFAACSTPREDCISDATRDLRILNSLVRETQANIDRGYALEERQDIRTRTRFCRGEDSDGSRFGFPCRQVETVTTTRPVAIDLNAEQAKLASLLERQAQAKVTSDQRVTQCLAVHPE